MSPSTFELTAVTWIHQRTAGAGAGQVVIDRHVGQVGSAGVGHRDGVMQPIARTHIARPVFIIVAGQCLDRLQ